MDNISNPQPEDELEYNDGLGDLLREKERQEFSWTKTSIVLVAIIAIIFGILTVSFKISKSLLLTKNEGFKEQVISDFQNEDDSQSLQALIESIEKENKTPSLPNTQPKTEKQIAKHGHSHSNTTQPHPHQPQTQAKPNTQTTTKTPSRMDTTPYKVFVGNYENIKEAMAYGQKLKGQQIDNFVRKLKNEDKTTYRVQVGAFSNKKHAQELVKSLNKKGLVAVIREL